MAIGPCSPTQTPQSDFLTVIYMHDSKAGNWLFCGRRWRNPADAGDRAALAAGHAALRDAAAAAMAAWDLDDFLQVV